MEVSQLRVNIGQIRELTDDEKKIYSGYKYVTISEFYCDYDSHNICIPVNFLTDGSSGGPDYGCSWLFHDYLYATHEFTPGDTCTRTEADNLMNKILQNERLDMYRWLFIKVSWLNIFWLFSKAWDSSGKRGANFLIQTGIDLLKDV